MPFDLDPRDETRSSARGSRGATGAAARSERIAALDGLRALMAWSVALYHFGLLARAFPAGTTASSVVVVLGLHSVEAFFVLSGLCLFLWHGDMTLQRDALVRFYVQRFARIAPVFYLVLAINLALSEPVGPPLSWAVLVENLTFTFGLDHPNLALVVGGWSIGLEMVFYASFPLLAVLLRSHGRLAVAATLAGGLAWWYSARVVAPAPDLARFNAYVLMPNHAFAFLLGGLIARLRQHTAARIPWLSVCVVAAVSLGAWIASEPRVIDHFEVVLGVPRVKYVGCAAALIALCALTRITSARACATLALAGELTYAVYLLHPLAWVLCRAWLPRQTPALVAVACALTTTLGLSLLAERFFERPIRDRFSKLWRAQPRRGLELSAAEAELGHVRS